MFEAQTRLTIEGERFCINGRPTCSGTSAEGMLFNVRTVNATFEDTLGKVRWWDDDGTHPENDHAGYGRWRAGESADANTDRFIAALDAYRACGVLAVNLNVQGGHPLMGKTEVPEGRGSAGARANGHRDFYHNSGFNADGSIDDAYAERIGRVVEACDQRGMAVILQLFYFGQDTALADETAVDNAVDHAVDLVCDRRWHNVIIEIANEIMAGHYHHAILKPGRVAELIHRARDRARQQTGLRLPVSTSEAALNHTGQWTIQQIDEVFSASDVVLLHGGDDVETGRVGDTSIVADKIELIRSRGWFAARGRPIVFNESDGAQAMETAFRMGASFGLHTSNQQTMWPPRWGVWDSRAAWFFRRVRELTGGAGSGRS